jgi:hypothetical protein
MTVAYGCCVGSWERFGQWVAPRVGPAQVLGLAGQFSIAEAYNSILDAYLPRVLDAVILVHDDLEMIDPDTEAKVLAAFEDPTVGLAGVAGGFGVTSLAWWNASTVGHQQIDAQMLDFGPRAGDVDLLEGSFLAFSPQAVRRLRFNPIPGFHGYDEIAAQCKAADMRVVVVDIDTHHHTRLGFDSPQSYAAWLEGDRIFREKWIS